MGLPTSYLFVPANRPRLYEKALASGADAVIVDLEDAVGPDGKVDARRELSEWLTTASASIVVRTNAPGTPWFAGDIAACLHPRVMAISIPKVESGACLALASSRRLAAQALLPFIESAAALDAAREIGAVPGVQRLIFGSLDFQLDLGIDDDDEGLAYFRSALVQASRRANLAAPVDGVTTHFTDEARVTAETARARRLGFGAKLCIHPRQVGPVNAGFAPTAADVARAERVVAADKAAAGDATSLDGSMIDRPVLERAKEVLRRAKRGAE